nr:Ig-like domain-containing protein [Corynebacterium lactis]
MTNIKTTENIGYWTFNATHPHTFTLDYTVGPDCKPGQQLQSGFWYKYGTFLQSKTYAPNLFKGGPLATIQGTPAEPTDPPAPAKADTTTKLVDAPNEAILNLPVTLKASVTSDKQAELKDQKVTFNNGGAELCTGTLDESGSASCEWTPTTATTVNLQASYAGNDAFKPSRSEIKRVNVVTPPPAQPTDVTVVPQNPNSLEWTTVKGKAEKGTIVEAVGPGGTRCVSPTSETGEFSCVLGYLPVGQKQKITVTAIRGDVKSTPAEIEVNTTAKPGLGGWTLPKLPGLSSPGLTSPGVATR